MRTAVAVSTRGDALRVGRSQFLGVGRWELIGSWALRSWELTRPGPGEAEPRLVNYCGPRISTSERLNRSATGAVSLMVTMVPTVGTVPFSRCTQ